MSTHGFLFPSGWATSTILSFLLGVSLDKVPEEQGPQNPIRSDQKAPLPSCGLVAFCFLPWRLNAFLTPRFVGRKQEVKWKSQAWGGKQALPFPYAREGPALMILFSCVISAACVQKESCTSAPSRGEFEASGK